MAALVAIAPLALIVFLMAVLRWSAANAGLAGLVAATAGAIGFFGFGTSIYPEQGIAGALIGTGAEAVFSAVDILWIILPALSLYELQQRSGAIDTIRMGLMSLSSDKTLLALIIAWFFAPFMEGAAGFGTPIALAAPLLVSLGFTPVVAVALPLIGHVTGTSFGALGTPIFAQTDVSGISGSSIAPPTALLHASLAPLLVLSIVFIAGAGRSRRNTRHGPSSLPFVSCCLTWLWPGGLDRSCRHLAERLPADRHSLLLSGECMRSNPKL
jgi:lactate permease